MAEGGVEVVGQVLRHHAAGGRGVDAHVVRRVVEELAPAVPLDVVSVVVTPPVRECGRIGLLGVSFRNYLLNRRMNSVGMDFIKLFFCVLLTLKLLQANQV